MVLRYKIFYVRLIKNGDYKYHRDTEVTKQVKNLEFKVPSIKRGFRGVFDTAVYKPFIQYSPCLCASYGVKSV